jgi:hypothetical protein
LVNAAFSPEGQLIALLDAAGLVKVWHFSEGNTRPLGRLLSLDAMGLPTPLEEGQIIFHPDGSRLLASNERESRLWDVKSGRQIQSWMKGWDGTEPEFLEDGRLILAWGQVLDPRPVTDDIRDERDALALIRRLCSPPRAKADVVAAITAEQPLREAVRQCALKLTATLQQQNEELLASSQARLEWPFTDPHDSNLAVRACESVLRDESYVHASEVRYVLGRVYFHRGQFKEAFEMFSQSEDEDRNSGKVDSGKLAWLAMTLQHLDRGSKAHNYLKMAKESKATGTSITAAAKAEADGLVQQTAALVGCAEFSADLSADPFAP